MTEFDLATDRAVVVQNLTVSFPHPDHPVVALDGFSASARTGEVVGIVGPSGSGKTTLLSALGGMVPVADGTVSVGGVDVLALRGRALEQYRREMIGIVFQGFNLMPGLTAAENVALPLLVAGTRPSVALRRATDMLGELGLHDRRGHRPTELSGGQKQRVAVARGLINEPVVLLADEPTANLDRHSAESVVALLHSLRDSGRTVLVSTHDDRVAEALDHVVTLGQSRTLDLDATSLSFAGGHMVYDVGSVADCGFEILDGQVQVIAPVDGHDDVIAVLGAGERFGELEAQLGCRRAASVRALERTTVRPLHTQKRAATGMSG